MVVSEELEAAARAGALACVQVDMPVPEKEIDVEKELQRLEKQLNQVGPLDLLQDSYDSYDRV